jgi:hypothetical protein
MAQDERRGQVADSFVRREFTSLDRWMVGGLLFILIVLSLNVVLRWLWVVYVAIVGLLAALDHANRQQDGAEKPLGDMWTLAIASVVLYSLFDYVLASGLGLVSYLTNDPKIVSTPPYVMGYWAFGVLLFGYTCRRVRALTGKAWLAGLASASLSAVGAWGVEALFNAMHFYHNTPASVMIGPIPLYVPLGYFATFLFMPLYLRWKRVFGFLLYGIAASFWYLFHFLLAQIS